MPWELVKEPQLSLGKQALYVPKENKAGWSWGNYWMTFLGMVISFFNLKYSGEKSSSKKFSLDLALAPCQIGETMKLNP